MKKNPIHSYLYFQYRKQVRIINDLHYKIIQYKSFLLLRRGNDYAINQTKIALHQTREKLKYHQSIIKYLKQEILYYNYKYNNNIL